jgi:RNA 2',3'-cyclic 3'-phosphodiesterase
VADPRLFVAIPLPGPLTARLLELQAALPSPTWDLALSGPEDLHLTLHYLGPTPARVTDDLKRELGALAHARRPFDLPVQGVGAFPHDADPRVLWAGVSDPHGRLAELFEAARRVLNAYRLFKLREELQPHLTLARVRRLSAAWSPQPLRALAAGTGALGLLPVQSFQLMRSRAAEEGPPRYGRLAEMALQA